MIFFIIRFFILILLPFTGFMLVQQQPWFEVGPTGGAVGVIVGVIPAILILLYDRKLKLVRLSRVFWAMVGMFAGFLIAYVIHLTLLQVPPLEPISNLIRIFMAILLGYSGFILGYLNYDNLSLSNLVAMFKGNPVEQNLKILDTSVIIDGRIADICETGFLEGTLIIPQFILKELQHIADSSDMLKRNRGRRGLDILQKIQKLVNVEVEIVETDFPKIREVDAKLVELGKLNGGKILTNDFNLNKIAELQGVSVLNVNELANALKPVVLPGEIMKVKIMKEGKEYGQGVAYLDDGTMVVVDNANNVIGKDVEVSVTSVLQTTAGRMIFSKLK